MSPQHLQQLDLYHERLIGARLDALESINWGVIKCEVDRRALESGQVRVQELTCVMNDGLVIDCRPGDPELPPSRPVEGHFPHTQTVLEVYIGIPRERDGVANYAEPNGQSGRTRFVIANKTVPDLTGEGQSLDLAFAQRNIQILFGAEPKDDFEAMKIAEVTRDASGALAINDPFIPPCLRIEASPFILAGMRRLLRLMSTRRRALAEAARERGDATVEYNAGDITRFLLLNAINTYLPGAQPPGRHARGPAAHRLHLAHHAGRSARHVQLRVRPGEHAEVQPQRSAEHLRAALRARHRAASGDGERALRLHHARRARGRDVPRGSSPTIA